MDSQISWWIGFHVFVLVMLALDLGVFHKNNHVVSVKESLMWTGVWITLAMIFNYSVYHFIGEREAYEFLTAYVLEKSLSVDNIFVMTLIFAFFKVEQRFQHRVLFWGILGALVMRVVFIVGGVTLINRFHFILYFFGAFLIYTGAKMLMAGGDEEHNPEESFIYKFAKKNFRMTEHFHGEKFFMIQNGIRYITPLFLVLLIIESTDLLFAVDSIPATLSVTKNAFIAYTSNIFAIMGLRSLYFAFAGVVQLFRFLSYALSIVLIFIGVKMLIDHWYTIPTFYSLGVVLGIITLSILFSVLIPSSESK
ncbi:MAG: TerC family protein [Bacteriovorax sp.]|nr:TerC family protein [Bacteriovorax sp.]